LKQMSSKCPSRSRVLRAYVMRSSLGERTAWVSALRRRSLNADMMN